MQSTVIRVGPVQSQADSCKLIFLIKGSSFVILPQKLSVTQQAKMHLVCLISIVMAYANAQNVVTNPVDCNSREDNLQNCLSEMRKSANWTKLVETKTHMAENCINKQQDLPKRDRMFKCLQGFSQADRCINDIRNDPVVSQAKSNLRVKYGESVSQHPACPFQVLKDHLNEGIHKGECVLHRENSTEPQQKQEDPNNDCQLLDECLDEDVANDKGSMRILIQYADGVLNARRQCLLQFGPLIECMASEKSYPISQAERIAFRMAETHFMEVCSTGVPTPTVNHPTDNRVVPTVSGNNNVVNSGSSVGPTVSTASTVSHPISHGINTVPTTLVSTITGSTPTHPGQTTIQPHTAETTTLHLVVMNGTGMEPHQVNQTNMDPNQQNNTTHPDHQDPTTPATTTTQHH